MMLSKLIAMQQGLFEGKLVKLVRAYYGEIIQYFSILFSDHERKYVGE